MSLRHFILGLSVSFGVAWMAIIVIPFFKMRNIAPIALTEEPTSDMFFPKRTGRVADGAKIYAENGCYVCHTQVVRPTYAGNDMFRPDWGGLKADPDRGDTRRETNEFDFLGEKFAQIGVNRFGPDLSNLGRRVEGLYAPAPDSPTRWLYAYLYNPRYEADRVESGCPGFRFLFDKHTIGSAPSEDAVTFSDGRSPGDDTTEWVPNSDAKALVSYLLSLKKDQPVPDSLNFAREKKEAAAK
jgi:cytochrome c oxidase cbb3-type subunit 2